MQVVDLSDRRARDYAIYLHRCVAYMFATWWLAATG
jgi:L-rhamnose mutarotase